MGEAPSGQPTRFPVPPRPPSMPHAAWVLSHAADAPEQLAGQDRSRRGKPDGQWVEAGPRRLALAPFTYNTHYCSVDRSDSPTILACSTFESGVRVFDIRDFRSPEIAYFNPGGDGTRQSGSYGGTTGGYASASPRIVEETGELWFTDQDRGFYVTRFTNGVWPFPGNGPRRDTSSGGEQVAPIASACRVWRSTCCSRPAFRDSPRPRHPPPGMSGSPAARTAVGLVRREERCRRRGRRSG